MRQSSGRFRRIKTIGLVVVVCIFFGVRFISLLLWSTNNDGAVGTHNNLAIPTKQPQSHQQHLMFTNGNVDDMPKNRYDSISFRPVGKIDSNVTIISRKPQNRGQEQQQSSSWECCNNAIVVLAQKQKHSTYQRDSYGLLVKSLKLIGQNYLSINEHYSNVDVYLFHTGDFNWQDIEYLESILLLPENTKYRQGILKLVNLNSTVFWTLPPWHAKDNQTAHWKGSDIFPIGYRHMCRWFGIKIWSFFDELNQHTGCTYRHLLRIDEDSFILSPIKYDIFDYMLHNQFVYGYRMCAYEMDYNRYIGAWLIKWKSKTNVKRDITNDMCGFYNNFFVADLQFFTSNLQVKSYLQQIHRQGFIYRKRYGDLMIHTTAVYSFAAPKQIHRFLDFTYQHVTTDHIIHPEQGCVVWGGIQAGYNDLQSESTLQQYVNEFVTSKHCTANTTYLTLPDLSPSYQHDIPTNFKSLKTITAGRVELSGKGILSG